MRNKVHNRCNVHRSARNQPPLVCEKVSSVKPVPGARKVGDHCLHPWLTYFIAGSLFCSYPEACLFVCLRVIFVVSWRLVWCGAKSLVVVLGLRSMQASIVAARRLSCSAACSILVSHQGIEPECLALPGRFLTTGLPGKSLPWGFYICIYIHTYNIKIYILYVLNCWVLHATCVSSGLHLQSPLLIIAGFDTVFVWVISYWTVCELLPVSFPICNFLVSSCGLFLLEKFLWHMC